MDWSTVVILAAVTLLDGVRRVPAGALVLRQVLAGRWTVADREAEPGLRLVSAWSSFTLPLIIPSGGVSGADAPGDHAHTSLDDRLARARGVVGFLRLLGASIVLAIVLGVPAAVAHPAPPCSM